MSTEIKLQKCELNKIIEKMESLRYAYCRCLRAINQCVGLSYTTTRINYAERAKQHFENWCILLCRFRQLAPAVHEYNMTKSVEHNAKNAAKKRERKAAKNAADLKRLEAHSTLEITLSQVRGMVNV